MKAKLSKSKSSKSKKGTVNKSVVINGYTLSYSGSTLVIPVDAAKALAINDLLEYKTVRIASECKNGVVVNPLFDLELLSKNHSVAHFNFDVDLLFDSSVKNLLENALVKFITSQPNCKIVRVDFTEHDPYFGYDQLIEGSQLSEIIAKAMFIHL